MTDVSVSIIVATDLEGAIGLGKTIPWRMPSDLKHFQQYTMNKIVVMGRKTFESLPVFLHGRVSVIISSDTDAIQAKVKALKAVSDEVPPIIHVDSLIGLGGVVDAIMEDYDVDKTEIVVIGGGTIYKQFLEFTDKVIMTVVDTKSGGDVLFPSLSEKMFSLVSTKSVPRHASDEFESSTFTFQRSKSNVVSFSDGKTLSWWDLARRTWRP